MTPDSFFTRLLSSFELANAIAEAGGFLVGLLVDSLQQIFPLLGQVGLHLHVFAHAPGRLSAVSGFAVDVLQQWSELVAEFLIIVGTTEPAGIAKLHEFQPANRALAVGSSRVVAGLQRRSALGHAPLLLGFIQVFLG